MARGRHFVGASIFWGFSWAQLVALHHLWLSCSIIISPRRFIRVYLDVSAWFMVSLLFCWKPLWRWTESMCQVSNSISYRWWAERGCCVIFLLYLRLLWISGLASSEEGVLKHMHWDRAGPTGLQYAPSSSVPRNQTDIAEDMGCSTGLFS